MDEKKILEKGQEGLSRRDFIKIGLAGAAAAGMAGTPLDALAQKPKPAAPPVLEYKPEKGAVLRVLRWSVFVKSDQEYWDKNTKKWEELTGCKVITEYISWEDVRSKAAMTASVGAGHDIVLGWHDDPHLYPDKLIDVTDLANYLDKKYEGFEPVAYKYGINAKTKRWICIPVGAPSMCMNYRISWMKEAGFEKFPDKIPEFIKLCKALKAKGHPTGFTLGKAVGDGNNNWHWWLWAFGGKVVEEDGVTLCLNKQETWDALEASREFYETMIPGVASWLDPHNNKAFLAGEISVTGNGISIYYAAKEKFPDIANDMDHANMPIGPVGKPTELHLFNEAFIFRHCKFPQAAKHYLKFMFEEPQYGPWIEAMRGYVTPSLKYYKKLPVWTADPKHTPFRDAMARMLWNGYAGPIGSASAATMAEYVVVDMFNDVCVGGKSPKAAAAAAQDRAARFYKPRAPKPPAKKA
ncbi:MAG: ABC transporter substrate-binding protein [Thermodesulfobacteriota bacterium]